MPEVQKPLRAQFKKSLQSSNKKPAVLLTVISTDNTLQTGEHLKVFINLVNSEFEQGQLSKLIIVTTGHLQKHYFPLSQSIYLNDAALNDQAESLDQAWLNSNKISLDQLKLPVEYISWEELLKKSAPGKPSFAELSQQVKDYFISNQGFYNITNKHAKQYVSRKIYNFLRSDGQTTEFEILLEIAIAYILEESAAYPLLMQCGADILTYPGGFNPPVSYLLKHIFAGFSLPYIPYEVKAYKLESNKLAKPKLNLSTCVNDILVNVQWSSKQKLQFMDKFQKLIEEINQLNLSPLAFTRN